MGVCVETELNKKAFIQIRSAQHEMFKVVTDGAAMGREVEFFKTKFQVYNERTKTLCWL